MPTGYQIHTVLNVSSNLTHEIARKFYKQLHENVIFGVSVDISAYFAGKRQKLFRIAHCINSYFVKS